MTKSRNTASWCIPCKSVSTLKTKNDHGFHSCHLGFGRPRTILVPSLDSPPYELAKRCKDNHAGSLKPSSVGVQACWSWPRARCALHLFKADAQAALHRPDFRARACELLLRLSANSSHDSPGIGRIPKVIARSLRCSLFRLCAYVA